MRCVKNHYKPKAIAHTCTLRIVMNLNTPKITKVSHHNKRGMHIKINTHQNDSNFLTPDLWSKTRLGMKHIHLELPKILSYIFTNKIRHISGINFF
jgi:hypothetical protein